MKSNFDIQNWQNNLKELNKKALLKESIVQEESSINIGELSAAEAEKLITDLARFYYDSREDLTNMDAKGISLHLAKAADLLRQRTGE